jgi:hypothetical protein
VLLVVLLPLPPQPAVMAKPKSIIKAPAHKTIFFFMLSFPPWISLAISFFGFEFHRIASGAGPSARPAGVHMKNSPAHSALNKSMIGKNRGKL